MHSHYLKWKRLNNLKEYILLGLGHFFKKMNVTNQVLYVFFKKYNQVAFLMKFQDPFLNF